jgi:hypothetical protein
MDTYSRPLLVKPHQDDLRREAELARIARADRPVEPGVVRLFLASVAGRLALAVRAVVIRPARRLVVAGRSRLAEAAHHGRRAHEAARSAVTPPQGGETHSHARP